MADNITKTDDEKWKVTGMDGEELENSPYDTKKKAKQAFNAHKLNYSEDDADKDATEGDTENDKTENDNNAESSFNPMRLLSNKYVIAGGIGLGYLFLKSDGSNHNNVKETENKKEADEQEESQGDGTETENLDSGRKSAEDLFE